MIRQTIDAILGIQRLGRVYILLSPGDKHWAGIFPEGLPERMEVLWCGGESRSATVRNGLEAIAEGVAADDWILVHDAARPCIDPHRVDAMIDVLQDDPVGG